MKRDTDDSLRFSIPGDNEIIWKYMSFEKFLLLILRRELYFKNVDNYLDYFEGHITDSEKGNLVNIFRKKNIPNPKSEANKVFESIAQYNATYIDCWHKNSKESYAMWRVFGESKNCIALKTTVGKLRINYNRFKTFGKKFQIIPYDVMYYDNETSDEYPFSNMFLYLRKPFYFHYEMEIRGIIQINGDSIKDIFPDIRVPIVPEELIDSIMISPFSDIWFSDLVVDLLKKMKIKVEVKMSKIKQ